jgi:hypothetical protein
MAHRADSSSDPLVKRLWWPPSATVTADLKQPDVQEHMEEPAYDAPADNDMGYHIDTC